MLPMRATVHGVLAFYASLAHSQPHNSAAHECPHLGLVVCEERQAALGDAHGHVAVHQVRGGLNALQGRGGGEQRRVRQESATLLLC